MHRVFAVGVIRRRAAEIDRRERYQLVAVGRQLFLRGDVPGADVAQPELRVRRLLLLGVGQRLLQPNLVIRPAAVQVDEQDHDHEEY